MKGNGNGKNPNQKPKRGNPYLVPGNPGNSGGKPGRSGRKTNDFKAELMRIRDEEVPARIYDLITNGKPSSAEWRWAVDRVLEYTTSKAPTKQEVGGGEIPVTFRLDL